MHVSFFTFALAAAATGLEAIFGYPAWLFERIGHPVTWMGRLIAVLDHNLNRDGDSSAIRYAAGVLALLVLLLATAACVQALSFALFDLSSLLSLLGQFGSGVIAFSCTALCASSCLAQRSLAEHVGNVARGLETGGVEAGRKALAHIVGRDVEKLDAGGIGRAAIESLAENFSDGIVAPAFWIAVLGPFGGFLYKAINTADSMIGHRTNRHAAFGFASAKLDDLVNLVPARLAAAWICLAAGGNISAACRITWRDASGHPSPNAGWPEAAMAGALGIRLGGPRTYAARKLDDAWIGEGRSDLAAADILRALQIYRRACAINFATLTLIALLALIFIARG
ncbi:MAG: adenosylcobinamide-phosphate synthase CbiB [Beijerinckiaceae bacterium]